MGSIQERITTADVVVADVSASRQDVMYELGFAHAREKPTILVSDEESRPTLYDLSALFVHLYKTSGRDTVFQERLVTEIVAALSEPDRFTLKTETDEVTASYPAVFVSYSHADDQWLKRLRVTCATT